MKFEVFKDADSVAQAAAATIAADARAAIASRGRFGPSCQWRSHSVDHAAGAR